jgi:hypothetical protein
MEDIGTSMSGLLGHMPTKYAVEQLMLKFKEFDVIQPHFPFEGINFCLEVAKCRKLLSEFVT